MYWIETYPLLSCPGKGLNFYRPEALCKNHDVSGGLIMNLNVRSVYAVSLHFKGTSPLICELTLLNYSQNFIILIPNGPNAWPILGFGLATPANTLKFTVAKTYFYFNTSIRHVLRFLWFVCSINLYQLSFVIINHLSDNLNKVKY